jgi:DNA-binding response OmpR family regulator
MEPKKILIVDDDPSIREILCAQLSRLHYAVCTASDGEEAVSQFKREKPDLILMDVMMPRLDGLAACQKIRALEKGSSRVPVLFLTARDAPHDKMSSALSGGDDFLPKPIAFQELRRHVEDALKKRRDRPA